MSLTANYRKLEPDIINLTLANLFILMINGAYFLIFNIYLAELGYSDPDIANFISYRFFAVMFFGLPFGLLIKGRRMRPVFFLASILLPIVSFLLLEAASNHWEGWLRVLLVIWGVLFSAMFITKVPFILRNARPDTHTEAIALNSATWNGSSIIAGIAIFVLTAALPQFFSNETVLQLFSLLGFCSFWFVYRMSPNEQVTDTETTTFKNMRNYDWQLIARALVPTAIISIGAGLAIPFMNLFFYNVFGMSAKTFALLGAVSSCIVTTSVLLVPYIKNNFGYEAITYTQTAAVIMLFILASSDFLSEYEWAFYLAIAAFLLRNPLMNLAGPMTSEMTMYYVGKRNQELISAISSSIWSGSWFLSSQIFRFLRSLEYGYGTIFCITGCLYIFGVTMYYLLIIDFRKREKLGLTFISDRKT